MNLAKILHIKKTGILDELDWSHLKDAPSPDADQDFKEVNLIFGWNGSGKTTLSRILRSFEIGELCEKLKRYSYSEFSFQLDDNSKLTETDIGNKKDIRVFNVDFVEESIFKKTEDGRGVAPIYYLGKETIELTMERNEKENKDKLLAEKRVTRAENKRKLDAQATGAAKDIKNALLGVKEYKNYNKQDFVTCFENLQKKMSAGGIVVDNLKLEQSIFDEKLREIKASEIIAPWIDDITTTSKKFTPAYIETIKHLLGKTVTIQKSIENLKNNWALSRWVQEGLKIHKEHKSKDCEFCGQILSEHRIAELEEHFSRDYTELSNLISEKIRELESWQIKNTEKIPSNDLKSIAENVNTVIQQLLDELFEKQKNLLSERVLSATFVSDILGKSDQILSDVSKFAKQILEKARTLEESLVADRFPSYKEKLDDEVLLKNDETRLQEEISALAKKIEESERSTKDFKLPARDINSDLEAFLGHKELKFEDTTDEFGEVSYQIKRNGESAFNLSEGEKTAISLIYFLRKLRGADFNAESGVVFIDDPISSMDSQFLYSAYSFIISALEKGPDELRVAQFFLSTHNYDFLNLFKRKYRSKIAKKKCGLYMFRLNVDTNGSRVSNLHPLDSLLAKFDSDYQYLYSKLNEFKSADEKVRANLTMIYPYPNMARRVLETFLSFKFPNQTDYKGKINAPSNVPTEMREAVYHFTNAESHGTLREASGFSPEILAPSAQGHLLSVLEFMKLVDSGHCEAMEGQHI